MTRRYGYALAAAITIAAISVAGVRAAHGVTIAAGPSSVRVQAVARPLSWRSYRVGQTGFAAVRCPSTSVCVAITDGGRLLSTRDAGAPHPTWTVTKGLKVMGPSEDEEQTTAYNLSCPSAQLCVTSDKTEILVSTDPTGPASAWQSVDVQPPGLNADGELDALSCPTTTLCVAGLNEFVDDSGGGTELELAASTDPTGGAGAWTVTTPATGTIDYMVDLACAPAGVCAGGDEYQDVIATTDGAAGGAGLKSVANLKSELDYVACPSSSLCVGADDTGKLAYSTAPVSKRWHEVGLGAEPVLEDVSCSSVSFCGAIGVGARRPYPAAVLTSTTPTRAGSWTFRTLAVGGTRLTSISCRSRSFCVAVGEDGLVVVGSG